MAQLTDCLYRPMRAGHWRSENLDECNRSVWHYSTIMLTFCIDSEGRPDTSVGSTLLMSLGHGSVSDQQGMNRMFRALNVPFYYSRSGGAQITCNDPDWRMSEVVSGTHARLFQSVPVAKVLDGWPIRLVSTG
jgi:hypothetical protein